VEADLDEGDENEDGIYGDDDFGRDGAEDDEGQVEGKE